VAKKKAPAKKAAPPSELAGIPAFAGMNAADRDLFRGAMSERNLSEGEPLFREGDAGEGLWVVLKGDVSIVKRNAKGGEREVAVLEAHEVIGEMDLISDRPHNTGARARSDCGLLFLPKKAFQDLLRKGNPGAASMVVYFARMLAGRLDANNKRMLEILDAPPRAPGSSEFSEFKRRLLKEWSF